MNQIEGLLPTQVHHSIRSPVLVYSQRGGNLVAGSENRRGSLLVSVAVAASTSLAAAGSLADHTLGVGGEQIGAPDVDLESDELGLSDAYYYMLVPLPLHFYEVSCWRAFDIFEI